MQLEPIIAALRVRCASFANRIAGASQFKLLPENASLPVPCAFVIPLDDAPKENMALNSVRQPLNDSFSVIVAVSNLADEKGQVGSSNIHALRAELWAALLGWQPGPDYKGVAYEGGALLSMDRARLWYQFEFGAEMEIGPEDGYQETELAQLPHYDGGTIKIDALDPADPNKANPLDGRFEAVLPYPKGGNLP